MSFFQLLRLWSRRAPLLERVAVLAAAALILSTLGWVGVPGRSHRSSANVNVGSGTGQGTGNVVSSGGQAATGGSGGALNGTAAVNGVATSAGAGGGSGNTGVGGGASGSAGGGSCVSPPGSDQGVSSSQIKIAVFILQVVGPAGNSVASIPAPSEQEEDFSQVMDTVNASGGVACRKLVPQFFTVNPVDQTDLQQTCLNVQQAAPFTVFDPGAYALNPATANCYPQSAIPYMYNSSPPTKQQTQDYPYLFSTSSLAEVLYRNTVFALNQRGFFSAVDGFKKLGILYRDCEPEYLGEEEGWLNQLGVASSQIVAYDLGCPSSIYAPPSAVEQAVLTFQQDGVTNVTEINEFTDFNNFTNFAGRQRFKPKYGIPNDQVLATSTGSPHADYNNLDGAIAISSDREGENTTPGYVPSSGTARCNAIMAAHGRPPIYQQEDGFGGVACSLVWMFQAALSHAPAVKRSALAAGLESARSVDFSFAFGPNDYSGSRVTTGGEYWRAVEFFSSCGCWHVTDPTFHPSFS